MTSIYKYKGNKGVLNSTRQAELRYLRDPEKTSEDVTVHLVDYIVNSRLTKACVILI